MMRFFTRILHVFAISILFVKGKVDETGYVEIPQGKLQGIVKPNHIAFHGIPYAQPPVGPERWRKTKPGANWSGIKDVTDTNLVQTCIQNTDLNYPRPVSEDCLYLHIYMPRVNHLVRPGTNTYVPRSVMFWIHGGAFTRGSGSLSLYDGQHMVEQSGAIVVTVNYRLGGFGFMYDDDFESVPGNQGMWDIIEALKWVKSNIHHFYGDPDSITVFGESAGGQATSVLLALKEVENRQNLFRNAIVQSAPIGIPFRNKQQAIDLSHHFLEDLGCFNFTKTVDRWDCAREKSVDEINIVLRRMKPDPIDDIYSSLLEQFSPMLDDVLLDLHPYEAIKQGRSQDKSIMVGHTTGEGATFVYAIFRTQMNQVFYKVLVDNWYHGNETIIEKILERYPPCRATDRTCDNRKDVSEIVSESLFFCPLRDMMKNRAAFTLERQIPNLAEPTRFLPGKTFRYIFDHPSAIVPEIQNITICEQISCHTAELPLIFQTFKELGWSPTIPELNLSRKMIGYWTNFAWSNNPNSAPHEYHEDNKYAENLPCWPQFLNNPEFNQACQDDPEKFYKSMYLKTEEFDQHITPDEIDANCDFWDSLDLYLKY